MSLEAIEKIQGFEQAAEAALAQARAQAQKIVAEAEGQGQALLQQQKAQAAQAAQAALAGAEQQAGQRRSELLHRAEDNCRSLAAAAQAHMDEAVKMIVERAVEG